MIFAELPVEECAGAIAGGDVADFRLAAGKLGEYGAAHRMGERSIEFRQAVGGFHHAPRV